jgi:hypothetical protein
LRLVADLEMGLGVGKGKEPVRIQVPEEALEQQKAEEME